MLSGLKYSKNKMRNFAQERFSVQNMAYTQMFIEYLHAKNPCKIKFFDECGLKLAFTESNCIDMLLSGKGEFFSFIIMSRLT